MLHARQAFDLLCVMMLMTHPWIWEEIRIEALKRKFRMFWLARRCSCRRRAGPSSSMAFELIDDRLMSTEHEPRLCCADCLGRMNGCRLCGTLTWPGEREGMLRRAAGLHPVPLLLPPHAHISGARPGPKRFRRCWRRRNALQNPSEMRFGHMLSSTPLGCA